MRRLVGERPATRGFYGNGGSVARDNLVIGIADGAGTGRVPRGRVGPGGNGDGGTTAGAALWKRDESDAK